MKAQPDPLSRRFPGRFPPLPIGTFIGMLHLMIAILGAGVITIFSLYFIYRSGEQSNLREIEDLAFVTENILEEPFLNYKKGNGSPGLLEIALNSSLKMHPDVRYGILLTDGTQLPSETPTRALRGLSIEAPEVRDAMTNSIGHSIRPNAQGQRTIFVATTIEHGLEVDGFLVLAVPFGPAMASTYRIMSWIIVIALLIVAFTVGEGWLGSIYISRPVVRLSKVAEQLSQGNLNARAEPRGPAEVVHLAQTLNEMAARLQSSLDSLRAFVANASHELRTPLTTMKLQVGALRSGASEDPEAAEHFLAQLEGEIDRLGQTVNDMLDLSQIEGGPPPRLQPVNLHSLANEVQAFWEARSHQAGLTLMLEADNDLPEILGDPYQLHRLFDNLLDNAIKNSPEGGRVSMTLRKCGAAVRIEILDTGIGIAPEHLAHIFDRFYRIDARSRAPGGKSTGSGLGLAIARTIVTAHGGTIGVNSQPGAGSTFWIEFPVK